MSSAAAWIWPSTAWAPWGCWTSAPSASPSGTRQPQQQVRGHRRAVGRRPERHGQDPGRPRGGLHHRHRRGRLLRPQAGYPVSRTSSARRTPWSPSRSTCSWPSSSAWSTWTPTARRRPPISSTAPPWAATSAPWPASLRSTPAPCPPGWPPSRCASCPSPTAPRTTALELREKLYALGYRVEVDDRNEKIGKKIREAQLEKVPYMLVVGDRDMENGTVSPRHRAAGTWGHVLRRLRGYAEEGRGREAEGQRPVIPRGLPIERKRPSGTGSSSAPAWWASSPTCVWWPLRCWWA